LLDSVIEEMLVGMAWRFQDKADFGDAPEPSKAMTPMAPMAPFERVGSNPAEPLRFVAWLPLGTSKTHISTGQLRTRDYSSKVKDSQHPAMLSISVTGNRSPHF